MRPSAPFALVVLEFGLVGACLGLWLAIGLESLGVLA